MLVYHNGKPIWLLHTGLYKYVQNISTNIWSYEKRTDFKLEERISFLISHNNTISWLYLPNGFRLWRGWEGGGGSNLPLPVPFSISRLPTPDFIQVPPVPYKYGDDTS